MGNSIETTQLHQFRVEHYHAQGLGRVLQEQGRGDGGDCDRLARSGGARDQQMRHLADVRCNRQTGHVPPQRDHQWRPLIVVGLAFQHRPQCHDGRLPIGDFEPQIILAWHRRFQPQPSGGQRQGEVVGQGNDFAYPGPAEYCALPVVGILAIGLNRIASDGRAHLHVHDFNVDVEFKERVLEQHDIAIDLFRIGRSQLEVCKRFQRRQLLPASDMDARLRLMIKGEEPAHTTVRTLHKSNLAASASRTTCGPVMWQRQHARTGTGSRFCTGLDLGGNVVRSESGRASCPARGRNVSRIGADSHDVQLLPLTRQSRATGNCRSPWPGARSLRTCGQVLSAPAKQRAHALQ